MLILSLLIQEQKKGEYYPKNGIITLKNHVDANHVMLTKRFEEEMNFPLRDVLKRQLGKKAKCV
jgi:hypothetical protein